MSTDVKELEKRMQGAMESLKKEFGGLRTGRASVNLLDPVHVDAYGSSMPLNQVASLSVPEPTLILATPFDPSLLSAIEKRDALRCRDHRSKG
jgi:ribosome recycling factor